MSGFGPVSVSASRGSRRGRRAVSVLIALLMVIGVLGVLGVVGPSAASAEDGRAESARGAVDMTDGLPARVVPTPGEAGQPEPKTSDQSVTMRVPDTGVAPRVTKLAASDGDVAVIVRLRDQIDPDALGDRADQAASSKVAYGRVKAAEDARARTVVRGLKQVADQSQAPVADLLDRLDTDGHASDVQPYWIFNGFSATVDAQALSRLEAAPEVASVELDKTIQLPESKIVSTPKLPTWGLDHVRAPQVWDEYGDEGQGVVVGTMDSGADGTHPALEHSWRGRTGDPKKSWFVATGENYPTPGDGFGHGTHVMGTILGGPPGDVVGTAPRATWIAAKIFNDGGAASTSGIHAAFQWMIAPGGDPTAAPDVVNNSWGAAATYNEEYRPDVNAWIAAGIVPVFANGNDGPGSSTVGSPGSFPETIAVGATDINDTIAGFSSRGPVVWDGVSMTKPDVSAPGQRIYSSWPADLGDGDYVSINGTSMATPHVTGVVALMLEANPNLTVDDVRELLTSTARQEPHMGALPDNDFGHGIVDAYAAVTKASNAGTFSGSVTGPSGPVAATLRVVGTDWRTTSVAGTGAFQLTVPAGTRQIEVSGPGLVSRTFTVTIEPGQVLTRYIGLLGAKSNQVKGSVRAGGKAVGDASVELVDSGVDPVHTTSNGNFTLTAPTGSYQVRVRASGFKPWSGSIQVPGGKLAVTLQALTTPSVDGWPQYQNNPQRNGATNAAVAPASLRPSWSSKAGSPLTFASPVIGDGTVFSPSDAGALQARDIDTGDQVWSQQLGDVLRGAPAYADGTVYVGGGLAGGINALDATTGKVRWTVPTPGQLTVYSYPVVDNGVVYVNTGPSDIEDSIYAIDANNGTVLWKRDIGVGAFGGPAVSKDLIVATSAGSGTVTALDRQTGKVVWTLPRTADTIYGGATIADGAVFVSTTSNTSDWEGSFVAIDAKTGKVIWEDPNHGDGQGGTPTISGDLVTSGVHSNGAIIAYDRATGEVAWRSNDSGPVSTSLMATSDGYVIAASQLDRKVFALDATNGKRVWEDTLAGNATSSAAYADGTLVTADVTGQLAAYRTTGSVQGVVRGPDGPIAANLQIVGTGVRATSDAETGKYTLDYRPGTFTVRVTAYGLSEQTREVTVVADRATSADFTMAAVGAGSVSGTITDGDGAPIEGAEVTVGGTPLDPVTTDASGAYSFSTVAEGTYSVTIDKQGYIPVTRDAAVSAGGAAKLDVALERYHVAVVDDFDGLMAKTLADLGYPAEATTYDAVTADPGWYDVVVANGSSDERPSNETIKAFIDATDGAKTSVVWMDTWGRLNGAIDELSGATGDPASMSYNYGSGRVSVVSKVDHPLTKGLELDQKTPMLKSGGWWSAFNDYSGVVVAGIHTDEQGDVGGGIAYKPRSTGSVHVLVSSLAAESINRPDEDWAPNAEKIIGNAVSYALDARPGEVTGTVTDASGQPVNAKVVAVGSPFHTTTEADGTYQLLVDPGTYTVRFRSPGQAAFTHTVEVAAGSTQILDASLTAADPGTVTGTVKDSRGAPVSGVQLTLEDTALTATSAADGSFTISDVPAEDYTLTATASGWFTQHQQVTVTAGDTATADVVVRKAPHVGILGDYSNTIATMLQQAGMTTESLTFSSTARIPSLDVVVFNDPSSTTAAVFDTWLKAMDANQVSGVFGDGYFSGDGGVRLLRQYNNNPAEARTQIDKLGEVSYHAIDADSPIFAGVKPDETVLLNDRHATGIPGYSGFPMATVSSDLGGDHGVGITYQPRTGHSVHLLLGGLVSEVLQRADEDWTPAARKIYSNAVTYAADPALGTVSGTVSGVDGVPVNGTVSVDGTGQRVTMGADGSYTLPLPPGDYTVRFGGFGYDEVTRDVTVSGDQSTPLDVRLAPASDAASISGVVTSGDQPVSGATVRLLGTPRQTKTAADGSYELAVVEPGAYQVDIAADGYLRDRRPVSVSAGQALDHGVALRTSATVGVVDDFEGRLANYLTYWGYQPHAMSWTDTSGMDQLDLVVANGASNSGQDPTSAGLEAFDLAAVRAGVSVVWLDQHGRGSFRYLSSYFGDPGSASSDRNGGTVKATVTKADHPIMAGLPSSFDLVDANGEFSWFGGFSGTTLATVSSDEGVGGGLVGVKPRGAAGVDVLVGALSVSTYGWPAYGDVAGKLWTSDAEHLFRNAIRYAVDAPAQGGEVNGVIGSAAGPLKGTVKVVESGRTYHTGADGAFTIGLPPGTWTLRASATNYAVTEQQVTVTTGQVASHDFDLTLLPNGSLSGTVKDASGAPVAGARVVVQGTEFEATSGADGSYTIRGIPAGEVTIAASAASLMTQRTQSTIVADQSTTADFVLGEAKQVAIFGDYRSSLRGLLEGDGYVITDFAAANLPDLAANVGDYDVVILNKGGDNAAFASVIDAADAAHVSLIFGGQWGGDAILDLSQVSGNPANVTYDFVAGPVAYVPTAAHPIFSGFEVGEPVTILQPDSENQQYLTFDGYSGSVIASAQAMTDGEQLGSAVGVRYTSGTSVEVLLGSLTATGYGSPGDGWTDAAEQIYLNAVAFASAAMRGQVVGTVTSGGQPVADATVSIDGQGTSTKTGADGSYSILAGNGTHTVRVEAFGYQPVEQQVTIANSETATADVSLTPIPRGTLTGRVTGGGGPIAGVQVSASGIENWTATTGADGSFSRAGLLPGTYQLSLRADGFLPKTVSVDVAGASTKVDVAMTSIQVGVLGDVDGDLVSFLRDHDVRAGGLDWSGSYDLDGYTVVVVNGSADQAVTKAQFAALDAEARREHVSLIYSGTWGSKVGGVRLLERFTDRVDVGAQGYGDGAVKLSHLEKKSPLFAGISDPSTILGAGSYYSVIAHYSGTDAADVQVSRSGQSAASGTGVAWSWRDRQSVELLLSSSAVTGRVGPDRGWTDAGEKLMLNAVKWAAVAKK